MKRFLAFLLILSVLLSFAPGALASTVPPGFKRLSDSDLETLCSSVNEKAGIYRWEYDKALGALVITYTETDVDDPSKSLAALVKGAADGDTAASNRLLLTEMIFKEYIDSVLDNFYANGSYCDVVLRCFDSLAGGALALEYVNGIRTSYLPS